MRHWESMWLSSAFCEAMIQVHWRELVSLFIFFFSLFSAKFRIDFAQPARNLNIDESAFYRTLHMRFFNSTSTAKSFSLHAGFTVYWKVFRFVWLAALASVPHGNCFFFRNIKNFLLASITRCLMKLPFMLWSEGGDIASCQRHINWSSLKRYTHLTMCTRCCTKVHSTSHRDESFMLSLPEGMQLNIIDSHVIRLEIIELNFNRKWFASELRQSAFVGSTRSCNQVATVAEKSALHSRCSSKVFQITYKQSQLHFTRNLCTQKHKHKHTKSLFVLGGKSFFRQKRRSKTAPQCAFKLDHCMSLCGNHTINNMPVGSREEETEKN